jgi:membrane associated rhomboid family serine protease
MPPRQDYGSQYRISFGGPFTPAVKALIIANSAVFVLELFVRGLMVPEAWDILLELFALNPILVLSEFRVWQLVTYAFMHSPDGIFHILFNMLILWMFGCELERSWGWRRFLRYYIICGIGGGLLNCAFALRSQTVGASGAIFGVIIAYGMTFPARTILFWGIFPMTARQFALLLTLIELVSLGAFSPDGVARFAHLGGALTGYVTLKGIWDPRRVLYEVKWKLRRRRFRALDNEDPGRSSKDRNYPFH